MENQRKYYYLDLNMKNCVVIGEVNGFPCYEYVARFAGNYAYPINAFLTMNNKIKILIFPVNENEEDIEAFKERLVFDGAVKLHYEGGVSAPDTGTRLIEIDKSMIQGNAFPLSIEFSFNNEDYNFHNTLYQLPKLNDETQIFDYARYLYNLLINRNISKFLEEMKPKIEDYTTAFYDSTDEYIADLKNFLNGLCDNLLLPEKLTESIFDLTPICSGSIFKIDFYKKNYLFETIPDESGNFYFLKIFVALINGELRIIR